MAWIARLVTAFSLSMFWVLAAEVPSFAQSCNSNANCAQDRTCQPGLFGGECRELKCNTNRDCPTSRRTCFGGVCQTGCSGNAQCGQGFLCQGRNQVRLGTCTRGPAAATRVRAAARACARRRAEVRAGEYRRHHQTARVPGQSSMQKQPMPKIAGRPDVGSRLSRRLAK